MWDDAMNSNLHEHCRSQRNNKNEHQNRSFFHLCFYCKLKSMGFLLISCDCNLSNTFLRVGVHIPSRSISFKQSLKIILQLLTVKSTNSKLLFPKVNSDLLPFCHLINIHTIVSCECWSILNWDIRQIMCDCLII
jgi:hypothetical protein